jgi:hypothetical protein
MARGTRARLLVAAIIGCMLLAAVPVASVSAATGTVTPVGTGGVTALSLAQTLVGSGVSSVTGAGLTGTTAASTSGTNAAAGTFSGLGSIINIDSGVVLSTGRAAGAVGANTNHLNDQSSTSVGAQLSHAFSGNAINDPQFRTAIGVSNSVGIYDRIALQFNFVPNGDRVFFRYVFASDEYPEWVGSDYYDAFAFFVNNQNCATVGSPPQPVTINTINGTSNADLFIPNVKPSQTTSAPYDFPFDGFTKVLTCEAPVNRGVTNTIRLVIADLNDSSIDSAVFIRAGSFTTTPEVSVDDVSGYEGQAIGLIGQVTDPDSPNPTTLWEIVSGGAGCMIANPAALATTITCPNNTVVTVKLSADDGVSPVATATGKVTVLNANPQVTISAPADGSSYRLLGYSVPVSVMASFTDPGVLDTHTCSINWGDGSTTNVGPVAGVCASEHYYTDPGNHTITVTVIDSDGGSGSDSITVHITPNDAPVVTSAAASVMVDEGQTATMTGTVSDPNGDSVQLSASIGEVIDNGDGTWSWSFATRNGPMNQVVTIIAVDAYGAMTFHGFELIVDNVAPSVTITTPVDGTQVRLTGSSVAVTVNATFTDPGVDDVHSCIIDWGDGSLFDAFSIVTGSCQATHNYTAAGEYTIRVSIDDSDAALTVETVTIEVVANQAPQVVADAASVTVDEGQMATMGGTINDPEGDSVQLSASIGQVIDNGDGTWSWSFAAADGPSESDTVTITAEDEFGASAVAAFDLVVVNIAPSVAISAPADGAQVRLLGASVSVALESAFSDPGTLDTHECDIDWGDGTSTAVGTVIDTCDASHAYSTPGEFTITVTVTDSDGGVGTASVTVHIEENQAPNVAADNATVSVDEGQTATMGGTVSDPEGDSVQLSASVGQVIDNGDGTWSWSFATADGPSESQSVTITAEDEFGASAIAAFDLVVSNVAPSVAISAPANNSAVLIGSTVTVTATVVDPGVNDAVTCTIDVGNGPQVGTLSGNVCSGNVTFPLAGIYTITVVATDKDGASGQAAVQLIVHGVGKLTGGGWINSPAGAYPAQPALTNKVTFSLNAQYKKGASQPEGNSQFQLHALNVQVKSLQYQWLVVDQASGTAILKGTATVGNKATDANGNPYYFMVWAKDGNPNTIRIKVWSEGPNGETVLYDNGAAQSLGGGNVQVHKQ